MVDGPQGYQLVARLAEGGMGFVEIVVRREGSFARPYARKRLHPHLRREDAFLAMFAEEARLAGAVRHPNVVSVLDVGQDADGPFLILDYVDGVPLSALMERERAAGRALPVQLCVRIAAQVAAGLHAAHEARGPSGQPLGLVHRDVSSHNILLGFDGQVRVTDFGIAKARDNRARTHAGIMKGNRAYMSPEQLRFEELDRRSDLFSLGVVLFELLAGEPLYPGDAETTARRILHEPPPDVGELRTDVPPELGELLFELLAKEPAARPATAQEVATRLEQIAAALAVDEGVVGAAELMQERFRDEQERRRELLQRPPGAAAPDPGRRRGHRLGLALALLGACALATAVGLRARAPAGGRTRAPTQVWAGAWHGCAAGTDWVACWGKGNEGQLGYGWTNDRSTAERVPDLPPIRALAGGDFHTCACARDGRVFCWGRNEEGQLGFAGESQGLRPRPVPGLSACEQVAAGQGHSCVLAARRVRCWGDNRRGQLGAPGARARVAPVEVAAFGAVIGVAAAGDTTCVVREDGRVLCAGEDRHGLRGPPPAPAEPAPLPGLDGVIEVGMARTQVCARLGSGEVACWGQVGDEKVGVPVRLQPRPARVSGVSDAVALAVGAAHACVLRAHGELACFGSNHFGQLGIGAEQIYAGRARDVAGLGRVRAVAAGDVHTCAIGERGLACWGQNESGQVGDGTGLRRGRPVSVAGIPPPPSEPQ